MRFHKLILPLICLICLGFLSCTGAFSGPSGSNPTSTSGSNSGGSTTTDGSGNSSSSSGSYENTGFCEISVCDSESWDGPKSIRTENGKGSLVFQTPADPEDKTFFYIICISVDGNESTKELYESQTIVYNNLPLGTHHISCTAYLDGEIYAEGSTDVSIRSGRTSSVTLRLKKIPADPIPEGKTLSSFTVTYKGGPAIPGKLPTLNSSNFEISEHYEGETEDVEGKTKNYTFVSSTLDSFFKVGNIPITLKRKDTEITSTVEIPYKYISEAPAFDTVGPESETFAHLIGLSRTLHATTLTDSYTIYGSSESVKDELSYQWYKNGVAIDGETESDYKPSVSEVGEFKYKCVITYTPDADYSQSTEIGTLETKESVVTVAPWTLTIKDARENELKANSSGTYTLVKGEVYQFSLDNADTSVTGNSIKMGAISWSEIENSYLDIVKDDTNKFMVSIKEGFATSATSKIKASYQFAGSVYDLLTLNLNLIPAISGGDYSEWSSLKTQIESYTDTSIEKLFTISGTIEANETIEIKGRVQINAESGGATIHRAPGFKEYLFALTETGSKLTFAQNQRPITLDGKTKDGEQVEADESLIFVGDSCELNINNGVNLQNNHSSSPGGAIYVLNSTLNIFGGSIHDNVTTSSDFGGGGIYIEHTMGDAQAVLNMTNGTISNNSATKECGGGIRMKGGEVRITGTASVTSNSAIAGGGIYNETEDNPILIIQDTENVSGNRFVDDTTDVVYGPNIFEVYRIGESGDEINTPY